MGFCHALCLCLIFSQSLLTSASDDPASSDLVVQSLTGPIEGVLIKSLTDEDVVAYYGIPYAEPPVGELRFMPPIPIKPWTGILKATKKPFPCYQQYGSSSPEFHRKTKTVIPRPWSEDCLTLNVWIPRPIPEEDGVNIPILVFLHGGGFLTGSNLLPYSDGSTFAAHGGIFTVSVNSRLGPFGFLSLGHTDAPGNVGLMDQQVAIRWVKENIPSFGGRTGNIILWGTGSGAASVGYQIISPGNAGVFTSASMRSGAPTCSWAFQTPEIAHRKANSFASKLDCKREDPADEIACLRNRDPEDILDADLADYQETKLFFKPTVDGTFITEPPLEALRAGRFNNVSVLATTCTEDGSTSLLRRNFRTLSNATEAGICPCSFKKVVKNIAPELSEAEFEMVKDFYVDQCEPEDRFKLLDAAVRLYTDVVFDCCVETFIDYLSEKSLAVRLVYEQPLEKLPKWMGTTHAMDQLFFLGYPILGAKANYTEEEAKQSAALIKIGTYFAKKKFTHLELISSLYDKKNRNYIMWTKNSYVSKAYRHKQCALWKDLIPKLRQSKSTCDAV